MDFIILKIINSIILFLFIITIFIYKKILRFLGLFKYIKLKNFLILFLY